MILGLSHRVDLLALLIQVVDAILQLLVFLHQALKPAQLELLLFIEVANNDFFLVKLLCDGEILGL